MHTCTSVVVPSASLVFVDGLSTLLFSLVLGTLTLLYVRAFTNANTKSPTSRWSHIWSVKGLAWFPASPQKIDESLRRPRCRHFPLRPLLESAGASTTPRLCAYFTSVTSSPAQNIRNRLTAVFQYSKNSLRARGKEVKSFRTFSSE